MTDSTTPSGSASTAPDSDTGFGAPSSGSSTSSAQGRTRAPRPRNVSPQPLLYTLAIVLSSLVIPLPIFVGRLVELIVDGINPSNVDVTQPLAYLGTILGFAFGVLGVLILAIVAVYVMIYRREHTLDALKLPLMILAIQVVLGVLILLFNALINNAG